MTQEQQFGKGFNNGYLLAKHEPELIKKLLMAKNQNNDYFKGLISGKKEYEIEKMRLRLKAISKSGTPLKEVKSIKREK